MTESNNDGVPIDAFGGNCHRSDCTQPTPWDMSAIIINREHSYCSPECARAAFTEDASISSVAIHDPQYHMERPDGWPDGSVGWLMEVGGQGEARAWVDEFAVVFPDV
jgi:hypothetical protein